MTRVSVRGRKKPKAFFNMFYQCLEVPRVSNWNSKVDPIRVTLVLLELLIYLWMIYQLWNHDKENFKEKIITDQMRRDRNHKNIVTLKGQVITFLIEIIYSIYVAVHNSQAHFADASIRSISLIVGSTIISLVQILTSHEMMRFVKRRFNFWTRLVWSIPKQRTDFSLQKKLFSAEIIRDFSEFTKYRKNVIISRP